MPFDREANHYWGTVSVAPDPPTTGLMLGLPNPQAADFADLPLPFSAVVMFPGNAKLKPGGDTAEPVRVTQIVGNTLTLVREVSAEYRRGIRAGDQISASLIVSAGSA